ncbi:N-terminal acetyltransferase [Komagataella phaffii CBS 7435]|uniref:Protein with an apparent role in acetylation of N-terminal methionine residues n=2 Tax=Komagataella phaffii TaxID=460519 RepID=C4R2B0_KOMPG|nr:uncharacterized protein PAS_chr2-2_0278 [Komagataella phaffii GS115]AOA61956.1 GQ67_01054T0 [Komagataella phaffii]KAI0462090.1 hypothetical protein LJB42_004177 [Komagataella kurtzmanii]CAH2447814.1 N-terminal acetyltransferase [Komagataella phaffii CBS 7435]AOA67711.1 GQ68_00335T0 [Komagataella phaffii GS115]CAY69634.1 Protein with an apparent role in acetylation of N-terminal methionine residues [Komagataella phaffii GS115]
MLRLGLRATLRPVRSSVTPLRLANSVRLQSSSAAKKPTGIKKLFQEYGYSALGVYLGLTALDLPLCFLAVHSLGQEKVGELQNKVKKFFGFSPKEVEATDKEEDYWSIILTEFFIAYGIHKSLIFIRVPLTAAITPALVKKLRSLGFNVGKTKLTTIASATKESVSQHGLKHTMSTKGASEVVSKANQVKPIDYTASDPKFGKSPNKRQKWWNFFF